MDIIAVWIDEAVKLLVVAVVRSATVVLTFSNHELFISVLHDQIFCCHTYIFLIGGTFGSLMKTLEVV